MIGDIKKAIEDRKSRLISLMNDGNGLSAEKKHQLYGAINEIDVIIDILKNHRNLEITEEIKELKLIKPEKNKNLLFNFFKRKKIKKQDIKNNSLDKDIS
jgi:hypothetical protein